MNPKQIKALQALLTQPTKAAAAKEAGIDESTLRRYLSDPEFQKEYNATMCRLIAQAAENAAANAKDEDTARQLRYVANKGRGLDGRHYMQAFDSMADTLDRSLRRTYLIKSWDELTANILENF